MTDFNKRLTVYSRSSWLINWKILKEKKEIRKKFVFILISRCSMWWTRSHRCLIADAGSYNRKAMLFSKLKFAAFAQFYSSNCRIEISFHFLVCGFCRITKFKTISVLMKYLRCMYIVHCTLFFQIKYVNK